MKRYFMFAYHYEAQGGFNDLKGTYDTIDEAKDAVRNIGYFDEDDGHIVDIQQGKIVCWFGRYGDSTSGKFRKTNWRFSDVGEAMANPQAGTSPATSRPAQSPGH